MYCYKQNTILNFRKKLTVIFPTIHEIIHSVHLLGFFLELKNDNYDNNIKNILSKILKSLYSDYKITRI